MYDAMADFVRGESLFVNGWPVLVTFSPFRFVNIMKIFMQSGKRACVNLTQIIHNPFKSRDYEELKKVDLEKLFFKTFIPLDLGRREAGDFI